MKRKIVMSLSLLIALASGAMAQNADDIIAKYVDAIGGMDKLKAIQTEVDSGSMTQGGFEIKGVSYMKRPGMSLQTFSIQGKTGSQGYDGTNAWELNPFSGRDYVQKMDADQAKETKFEADMDGQLVDYAKKGYKVEYAGDEDVDGSSAYKLKLTTQTGDEYFFYIDKDSYLLVKMTSKTKTQDGSENENDTRFSDYNDENGVLKPLTITTTVHAAAQDFNSTIKISKVLVNVPLADSIFRMPADTIPPKK
jgi:hypothetical protein